VIKLALIAAPVVTSYLPTTPFDCFHAEFVARKILKRQGPNPLLQTELLTTTIQENPKQQRNEEK
jgi:hypothetical protein